MRSLVTGGTGFIGANLVRRLLSGGHEVHLLVRPGYSAWRIEGIRNSVRLHEVNFSDSESLNACLLAIRPDWIFHLAVYGAYPAQTDWRRMIATNVLGTANLLDACVTCGFDAFVNAGTSSEYGFKDHAPSETESLEPASHYAVTKAAAYMHCLYVARSRRVNVRTLRLYSAYGPYEEPTRLIPNIVTRGLSGQLPPLVDPEVARDFVHVDDVCEAFMLAALIPGDELGAAYNIGTGVQTTIRDAIEIARSQMSIDAVPEWGTMKNRHWDTGIWLANNRKAMVCLGWKPRYTFAEGLSASVRWFRENPAMEALYRLRQTEKA